MTGGQPCQLDLWISYLQPFPVSTTQHLVCLLLYPNLCIQSDCGFLICVVPFVVDSAVLVGPAFRRVPWTSDLGGIYRLIGNLQRYTSINRLEQAVENSFTRDCTCPSSLHVSSPSTAIRATFDSLSSVMLALSQVFNLLRVEKERSEDADETGITRYVFRRL